MHFVKVKQQTHYYHLFIEIFFEFLTVDMNPQAESTFDSLFKMLRGEKKSKVFEMIKIMITSLQVASHEKIQSQCQCFWPGNIGMHTHSVIDKVLTKKVQFQTLKKPSTMYVLENIYQKSSEISLFFL